MVSTPQKHALRLARERHGWSQSHLAELLETSFTSISQWERGVFLPSPHFREKLCTLFEKDAQELGLLPETHSEKSYLFDPFIPYQSFPPSGLIGRDTLFGSLVEQVCALQVPPHVTLYGLPGVGKTALLLALTQNKAIQRHFSEGILWAGLGPHPHLFEQLSRWGHLLQIPSKELKEHRDLPSLARCLRTHIGSRRFLLILDDVWQLEDALALHIGGSHCAYAVSTRLPGLAGQLSLQHTLHIPELEATHGTALLAHFLPHLAQQEPHMVEQIATQVGMLPLALTLIGKHLYPYDYLEQSERLHKALKKLQNLSDRLHLSQPQSFVEHHPSIPPERPISLEAAIAVSVQQLSLNAQHTLRSLAIVSAKPNSFSKELITVLTPNGEETLNDLMDAGLVEHCGIDRYTLHQTIADYALNTVALKTNKQATARKRLLNYAISWLDQHKEDYEQIELEYNNLLTALECAEQNNQHVSYVRLVLYFMPFWQTRGRYQQAETYLNHALIIVQDLQDRAGEIQIRTYLEEIAERQARNG